MLLLLFNRGDTKRILLMYTFVQAVADEDGNGVVGMVGQDEVAGAQRLRMRREGLRVLGVAVASVAVTGLLAAGEATPPATGVALLMVLIGGLSLATIPALRGH